ncbi:glycoside hydrolase family 15 protein [Nocardia rhamnosiphila]|uniref:glycoside hydrolase family 15 protein n=1 Tax=Nocardia rhamnosiphila TaxID=426716 RepID=UPI0033FD59D6
MVDAELPLPHVLREYALLADGQRGALVGPRGNISWMCVPGWADDAVFASLLGGHGTYTVAPTGPFVWGGYYETGTLIWRSRWIAGASVIECREALGFPGRRDRAVLVRRIVAVDGDSEVDVVLAPAAEFGTHPPHGARRDGDGVWTARLGSLQLRWSGGHTASLIEHRRGSYWTDRVTVPAGGHHDLVLEISVGTLPTQPLVADDIWAETEQGWYRHTPQLPRTVAERDAGHAYAVLRGMTAETGGMVAAATTSLPERADQGENYDYRYVWIRDQCLAGQAVAAAGGNRLLDAMVGFVTDRLWSDGAGLAPAYTVDGAPVPRLRALDLPGYPGAEPVTGNRVCDQFQLGIFGEILLLLAVAGRRDRLEQEHRRAVEVAVSAIAENHDRPDAGIWELDNQHWTHSRLTCAAGLRAVASCPATGADIAVCSALADRLLASASRDGLHPSGRWQRSPERAEVDAALLLPMIRGAVPVDDPRYVATFDAVERELCDDFYVYRFRHDERALEVCEGAFLLCGFTMAMAAAQLGRPVTAMRYFERNRAACGTPGLFAEEFDIRQRQLRGNLPQAFVHAMLLESAIGLVPIG